MLYVRMFILMGISLFASRVNLQLLGITDFGIYNAVGGIVGMFGIISGSMSVAISRYLTYELGTHNEQRLNKIFSTSINIQIMMSIIIILIAETVGLWFLNTQMNIPSDRMYAANWVFQCSILSFAVGLISVPYNALIISHERMSAFAYISILEAFLRLIICYCLYISPIDRLIMWSILLLGLQIFLRVIYGEYCIRNFGEAKYHFIFDKPLLKNMSKFIGWASFGNGAVVLKDQGTNILINIFCGPAVNAARGIAMQVNGVVCQLVTNVMMAVNPQITKSYSSGETSSMHSLIIRSGKLSFLLLCLVFFPLWPNINIVLSTWLVEVPEYAAPFVMLILAYSMLDCFASPLVTGVLAEGNIKTYEINITILYTLNVVSSYFFLKFGYSPVWVFILNIIFKAFVIYALLLQSRRRYGFPITQFLRASIIPCSKVFIICTLFVLIVRLPFENKLAFFLVSTLIILVFAVIIIYFVGLNKQESEFILKQLRTKIFKIQ